MRQKSEVYMDKIELATHRRQESTVLSGVNVIKLFFFVNDSDPRENKLMFLSSGQAFQLHSHKGTQK